MKLICVDESIKDFANYASGTRKEVLHFEVEDLNSFPIEIKKIAIDHARNHIEGMSVFHIDDQKYLSMSGPSSKNKTGWVWYFLELKSGPWEGSTLKSSFSSFKERFQAPVMAFESDHPESDELTFIQFTANDTKHYALSSIGQKIRDMVWKETSKKILKH